MTKLKESHQSTIKAKSKLMSIISELGEVEEESALEFISWCLEKSKYHKKHKLKEKLSGLPYKMQRGDIIKVDFGINIGDEFSDSGTGPHFAIYWEQNGFQIIVIPISAEERKPEKNDFAQNIGQIPGLPKGKDSYAKIDMIKSVSIRRISKIYGQKDGKIPLSIIKPEAIQQISDKIKEKFVIENL